MTKESFNSIPIRESLFLQSNLKLDILQNWINQNTNLQIELIDNIDNNINPIQEIKDKKTIKDKPIYKILIPRDFDNLSQTIKQEYLQKLQEYLRNNSFVNKNKELQDKDKELSLNQRIFNYQVGKYLNSLIDIYTNELNDNNKKDLEYLGDTFQDFSGLNTINFKSIKEEQDNKKLSEEEIERIEKYLIGEGVYDNLQKKIQNTNNKSQPKLKLIQKYLRILIKCSLRKSRSIKSDIFLTKHQININKERIDNHEIHRLINEYGLQDIFLDQNFVKEEIKDERSLLIKLFNLFKKEENKYINIKDKVEEIKKENIDSVEKVKKIVSLIWNKINYNIEDTSFVTSSPKRFQESQMTQCVGYTQLGKYLEDMSNIYCLPINITEHILALTLINNELYFTDIAWHKFHKLYPSDFINGEKDISLLKKYAKGQETKSQTISFSQEFFDSIYRRKIINTSIFLQDKREAISSTILNNLAVLYFNQSNIETNINKKQALENKAEKYYLTAIEKGHVAAINNLAALYSDQYKRETNINKKIELENKAEKYCLMAIEKANVGAINNLAVLYRAQSERETNINKKIELENKAEKYYLMAIEKGNVDAINNLANLYSRQSEREKDTITKSKLERLSVWLRNIYKIYENRPLTKEKYSELLKMIQEVKE